jgi:hypothetical protein
VVEVVGGVVEVVGPVVVPVPPPVVAVTEEEVGKVVPEPFELPQAASSAMAKRTKARATERYRTCTSEDIGSD